MTDEPLRIGILGAARIAELSIVRPAAATGHRLAAVAARDPERAAAFAERHGVERVHASYDDLIADPEVEAVYNPLANGLHAPWSLRVLAAGKHLLTEKPSAGNAREAARVRDAARAAGSVFMEAFHYPYHPLFQRVVSLLDEGAIGEVGTSRPSLACRLPMRTIQGGPWSSPAGRRWTLAATACPHSHCWGATSVDHLGSSPAGRTCAPDHVPDFPRPHEDDSLELRRGGLTQVERLGSRSSYTYQLEAFVAAIRRGSPVVTDADFAVTVMELIDTAYSAADLPRRQSGRGEVTQPSA